MLVLSRKSGESLQIGHNVTITITQITGNRVKIGIEAPHDVHVRRSELPANGNRHLSNRCMALQSQRKLIKE